jgi:hypothetical protein
MHRPGQDSDWRGAFACSILRNQKPHLANTEAPSHIKTFTIEREVSYV